MNNSVSYKNIEIIQNFCKIINGVERQVHKHNYFLGHN